jgi:glutamate racemase
LPVIDVVTATLDFLKEKKGSKKIAVIGTSATINSHVYSNRLKNTPLDIIEKDCPLLVPFIEEGETKGELLEGVIEKYLKPLKGKVDTLVMACTHYPILRDEIAEFMETDVEIVDPGELAAVKLKDFLKENDMLGGNNKGDGRYFVTDLRESFKRVAEMFLGEGLDKRIEVVELDSVKM